MTDRCVVLQIAELIRHVIDQHTSPVPAVLEIPSKDCPYDASKDSILRRAKVGTVYLCVCVCVYERERVGAKNSYIINEKINSKTGRKKKRAIQTETKTDERVTNVHAYVHANCIYDAHVNSA